MWTDITGPVRRISGTTGTQTLFGGGKIIRIIAHASGSPGSVTLPDGMGGTISVVVPVGVPSFTYEPQHLACVIKAGGTIVFTGTDSFLVEYT